MAVYGLVKDVQFNKGASLYVPGKTQFVDGDVFLGGTGTGVTDEMLGPKVTRIFGDSAVGTKKAFDAYTKHQSGDDSAYNTNPRPFEGNDVQAQRNAIISSNDAPRSDWDQGVPTMQRLAMENKQAQDAVGNAQNAGVLTGRFDNAPTLAQKTYDQNARNDAIKNSQWDKSFDYNSYNDTENRKITKQNADNNELAAGITRTGGKGTNYSANAPDGVADIMSSAGVPPEIWGPIMNIESGGNPDGPPGDGGTSFGLFQLHQGGLGGNNSGDYLKNSTNNATIAAKSMGKHYADGVSKGLTGLELLRYVAYNGGWPTQMGRGALQTDPVVKNYDVELVKRFNGQTTNETKTMGTKPTDKINTNELVGRLNTLYTTKDSDGVTSVNQDTKTQLRAAIIGQGLPDDETDKLLILYGLPINK